MSKNSLSVTQIPEPFLAKFLFADTRLSFLWLLLRIYIGWQWVEAGWEKVNSPMWTGAKAGVALNGFLTGAFAKVGGEHPSVQGWYASFLHTAVQPNIQTFSYMVAFGELLVGVALILGIFTGIAAFFGAFMNMNYLFAGTISTNPFMFVIELFLILAWRVVGWIGLDRWVLPMLGTPWHKGEVFKKK
ncbi:MAG TPA: DoxX family protein [Patescibacteria group bacterium]